MTEAQKNRKLKKIEKLKKVLRSEKAKFGMYDDSYGRRYSIAHLYFEIGDYSISKRYLNWFYKNFPDDVTYSYFQLGAAVTYFETKKLKFAIKSIVELNASNLYIVDLLLGNPVLSHNKYEWNEFETLSWANEKIEDLRELVTPNFISWLADIHSNKEYQIWYKKFLSIMMLLKGMEVSEERSNLLDAKNQCLENWIKEFK